MNLRTGALLALVLLTGCSSGTPSAAPTTPPPTTASATAKPTPTPSKKPTATPSRTPAPITPPPATGTPIGVDGALVSRADPGAPVTVGESADCAAMFPDITRPSCAALTLDGGHLLWVTGRRS